MSQDTERYLYFKVGLLKDSFALEALWQDALKYHMIDQPAKLIAMRLTEYYEMKNGTIHSGTTAAPMTISDSASLTMLNGSGNSSSNGASKEESEISATNVTAARPPVARPHAAARPAGVSLVPANPPTSPLPPVSSSSPAAPPLAASQQPSGPSAPMPRASRPKAAFGQPELSLAVSSEVDQNAEDAADYWSLL